MRKLILLLILVSPALRAQTVSPVIAEFGKRAVGQFTVSNNALVPQAVVVEAMSFSVVAGQTKYRALDPGVDVKLSETSARLGPKSTRTFDYTITCQSLPCAVTLWSTLTGLHSPDGMKLAIHLPHVIYLCEKAKNCRASVLGQ